MNERLLDTNDPMLFDFFKEVVGPDCDNAAYDSRDSMIVATQAVYSAIADVIGNLRRVVSTLNDVYAPENLDVDPATPKGNVINALHYEIGEFNPNREPMSEIAKVSAALDAAYALVRDVSYQLRDRVQSEDARQRAWDRVEAATYKWNGLPLEWNEWKGYDE